MNRLNEADSGAGRFGQNAPCGNQWSAAFFAMLAAIRMQRGAVILIAGGRPKEKDFAAAVPLLRERVRRVLLIGEAAAAMQAAWGAHVPCTDCHTLAQAVAAARQTARPGETVLLAPACTSYDQFRAYPERGEAFRKYVTEKD